MRARKAQIPRAWSDTPHGLIDATRSIDDRRYGGLSIKLSRQTHKKCHPANSAKDRFSLRLYPHRMRTQVLFTALRTPQMILIVIQFESSTARDFTQRSARTTSFYRRPRESHRLHTFAALCTERCHHAKCHSSVAVVNKKNKRCNNEKNTHTTQEDIQHDVARICTRYVREPARAFWSLGKTPATQLYSPCRSDARM